MVSENECNSEDDVACWFSSGSRADTCLLSTTIRPEYTIASGTWMHHGHQMEFYLKIRRPNTPKHHTCTAK
jgi:hypothetical protein